MSRVFWDINQACLKLLTKSGQMSMLFVLSPVHPAVLFLHREEIYNIIFAVY